MPKGPYGSTLPPDAAGTRQRRAVKREPVEDRGRMYRKPVPPLHDDEYSLAHRAEDDVGYAMQIEQFPGKKIPARAPKRGD